MTIDRFGNQRPNPSPHAFRSSTNGAVSAEFAYDHNGNLTNDGEFVYEYDVENRLTRASRITDDDPFTTEVVGEYYYDALGRRVRKVVSNSGASLNGDFLWLWNPRWQLSQIRKHNGTTYAIVQEHIDAGPTAYIDDHVAYYDADAGTNGTPSILFIHADHMATTAALTGAAGTLVERYDYDPYSRTTVYDGSFANAAAVSAYGNPFLHQGLPLDAESGQFHNRFRQYDPRLGRFAQRDPLGYVDGPSLYSYLGMNPLSWVDPSGLILVDSTGQIIFKPIGPPVPAKEFFFDASDSDTVQPGIVYTDKADPDKADPRNDKHVVPVLKLQKGGDEKLKCDCGGRTFLRGKYFIDDNRPNEKGEKPVAS